MKKKEISGECICFFRRRVAACPCRSAPSSILFFSPLAFFSGTPLRGLFCVRPYDQRMGLERTRPYRVQKLTRSPRSGAVPLPFFQWKKRRVFFRTFEATTKKEERQSLPIPISSSPPFPPSTHAHSLLPPQARRSGRHSSSRGGKRRKRAVAKDEKTASKESKRKRNLSFSSTSLRWKKRGFFLLTSTTHLTPSSTTSHSLPSPLQAWRGDVQAIEALLEAGATVDLPDAESGW